MSALMRALICLPATSLRRAENSHTFKQRNLKETQDFGRDFEMTPVEGRYPSPTTRRRAFLPVVAVFMLSLFVGPREARGMSQAGTSTPQLKDRHILPGQEWLERNLKKHCEG